MKRLPLRVVCALVASITIGLQPLAVDARAGAPEAPATAQATLPLGQRLAGDPGSCADPSRDSSPSRPATSDRPLVFDEFIRPLVDTASTRRAQFATQDPRYHDRVDRDLNARRLNVALLGFGEEHGQTYDGLGISVTIVSLHLDTWEMTSISLSRDIRVPELEDPSAAPPREPWPLRDAYRERGFDGLRPILEAAAGLAVDFQVLIKDVFLRNYLRDVNGPVELVVPKDFHTNFYRLDGKEHGADLIPGGRQVLSPDRAMTFVLGEHIRPDGKADERSYRKNLLLKTLTCQARQKLASKDAGFVFNLLRFSLGELRGQNLATDFDFGLVAGGLGRVAQAFVRTRGNVDATFPGFGAARQLVIHDEVFGDGGVRRVHRIRDQPDSQGIPDHPLVKWEVRGRHLPPHLLIPIGSNPYAEDLVGEYWRSVRVLVRRTLSDPRGE